MCSFVFFLAKLCRWSGDIREGAEDYHYFKQKGWKGRRGKPNWTELGTLDYAAVSQWKMQTKLLQKFVS